MRAVFAGVVEMRVSELYTGLGAAISALVAVL